QAEELGFELGHAAVGAGAVGFEQVGDGLGAGGLAVAGVNQLDAQPGVGCEEDGLDHFAALVALGDDVAGGVSLRRGGDGAGPAFGGAGGDRVVGEDVGDRGGAVALAGAGDDAASAVAGGGIDGDEGAGEGGRRAPSPAFGGASPVNGGGGVLRFVGGGGLAPLPLRGEAGRGG